MREECGKNWKLQNEMQGGLSRAKSPKTQSCCGDAESPRFEEELERRMAAYDGANDGGRLGDGAGAVATGS
jgi:hypothetical protein